MRGHENNSFFTIHRFMPFTIAVIFASTLFLTLTFIIPAQAKLQRIDNTGLAEISGNGGFSLAVKNLQIFGFIDTLQYEASDNGYFGFKNIKLNNGTGGAFALNYDVGAVSKNGIIYVDVFEPTVASVGVGVVPTPMVRGMLSITAPYWDQDLTYSIGNVIIRDPSSSVTTNPVDLGSFELGPLELSSFSWFFSPPANGYGINWEHDFQLTIDHATYLYQPNPPTSKRLSVNRIYIGKSFSDYAGDDPTDPTTWKPNNGVDFGEFKVGDLFGDLSTGLPSDPAMFNVGEADIYGTGTLYGLVDFGISLQGSLRFESAVYGGIDFGPVAIDGIHAYRFEAMLIP